ncbi:RICIN domain-containing protein [Paludibaculum fermentans]|uniref:Ricin B lectin domain-containing protein n=1 Tax=Paludibaculum fermentans TaxID=1473598 RepID=A0A7S7SMT3_PALFE|nr:hypothetical protein [Paludibaculum fermentans]QOY89826.1 hypothetical protein IRI77_07700 [Paludibaculum fermentans]
MKTILPSLLRFVMPALLACLTLAPVASASDYDGSVWLTSAAQAPNGGTWVQLQTGVETGKTEARGGAPVYESVNEPGTIVAVPGKAGYWVVGKRGSIHARGGARELCGGHLQNCTNFPFEPEDWEFVTFAAATPDGQGLWALGRRGQVWTVGTATPYGDAIERYDLTATAIVPTPSGNGYYILKNDGGVHARGDAVFFGSTGGSFKKHYTGLVLSYTAAGLVNGYWMLNQDGGVTTYGDAAFLGSTGGNTENVTSLFPLDQGTRYAWIKRNGEIGISGSYRRGAVTTNTGGTTRLWTLQGNLDYPGAELHALPAGAGRTDGWIFWPVKRAGAIVYQLRNEHNGLCIELKGYDIAQGACQANVEGSQQTQAFALEFSGSYFYLVVPDWPRLVISALPGETRLKLVDRALVSPNLIYRWQVLEPTTISAADSGALLQAEASSSGQKWLVAPVTDAPNAPVRFIDAASGLCAEAQNGRSSYRLQLTACDGASSAQAFLLQETGPGVVRISPVAGSLSAAPSSVSPGAVEFVPEAQGSPWRLAASSGR